jgi:hypothetical protein
MNYTHTQRGPIWLILVAFSAAGFIAAWTVRDQASLAVGLTCLGAAMLVVALCFATLTVRDEGHSLLVRYGPVPLFHKRIAYETITDAKSTRSAFIDGWGIHYIPGRGWTFNLWGWTCVRLTVNGRTIRIGSDDAENLARFIRSRIAVTA